MVTTNEEVRNEAAKLANQSRMLFNELLQNTVTTRSQIMQRMLDPRRDLDAECGYPTEIQLADYKQMYDREGIGHRVVSIWPEESWNQDPMVHENEDPEETEFELAWNALQERHNLWHYLQRVDELSGIGEFGILLLGLSDGKELNQPVEGIELNGPRTGMPKEGVTPPDNRLLYVRTFDQTRVQIGKVVTDTKSPRYGQPETYNINFSRPSTDGDTSSIDRAEVHWTRVIHVADNRQCSEVFGTPRQKAVWNRLMDLRKLLGGSAEMFWKGAFPGISFETHPELGDVQIDVAALREEFAEFANGLNRFMATSGISAKPLAVQVADPESHINCQLRALCSTIRVPWRVFLGSEQAQLASEQDRNSFNKRIKVRRDKYLTPWVVRPLIDRLIMVGVLPTPVGDKTNQIDAEGADAVQEGYAYSVGWPDVEETTPSDQAEWGKTIVETMARYIQAQCNLLLPEIEFLTRIMGLETDEAEAILAQAEGLIALMDDGSDDGEVSDDGGNTGRGNSSTDGE